MNKIAVIVLLFFSTYTFAQKNALIKQLKDFVPQGFGIKDTAFGDLNNDKKMDVAMVLYALREDESDFVDTGMNLGRPLLLLIQQQKERLKEVKRNDRIIMCKSCGGVMGDPFQGITIQNNGFTVEFYGGSSSRWGNTYRFSWSASKQNWQLTKEKHVSFQGGDPEGTTQETNIPASETDYISIDKFDVNGSSEEIKGKVTASKSYFHNAPIASTKRKAYVMKGDTVNIVREYKSFYDVYFENANGNFTSGYVLKKDIEKL